MYQMAIVALLAAYQRIAWRIVSNITLSAAAGACCDAWLRRVVLGGRHMAWRQAPAYVVA